MPFSHTAGPPQIDAPQAWCDQSRNVLAGQTPVASATKTVPANQSAALTQVIRANRSTGQVRLIGTQDQADDADVRVRISAATGSNKRSTTPVLAGVGNGTMTEPTAGAATVLGAYTFTLRSLGTDSKAATLQLWGARIQAKNTGAGGNSITITVDPTNAGAGATLPGITRTDSGITVPEDIPEGTTELVGQRWNMIGDIDNGRLDENGHIDLAKNPRIAFGFSELVLRQYYQIRGGKTVFLFDHELPAQIDQGTRVYNVTGAYTVTVTDGINPIEIVDVVTRFDLLTGLAEAKRHVDVLDLLVTDDRSPGGIGSLEMDLRTAAYIESVDFNGEVRPGREVVADVIPNANATTQAITATFHLANDSYPDRWLVTSSTGGNLGQVSTGGRFVGQSVEFTIQEQELLEPGKISEVRLHSQSLSGNAHASLLSWVVGPQGKPKEFVFELINKPDLEADPPDPLVNFLDGPLNPDCVGGGEIAGLGVAIVADVDPTVQVHWSKVSQWYEDQVLANFEVGSISVFSGVITRLTGATDPNADPPLDRTTSQLAELQFLRDVRNACYLALDTAIGNAPAIAAVGLVIDGFVTPGDAEWNEFLASASPSGTMWDTADVGGLAEAMAARATARLENALGANGIKSPFDEASNNNNGGSCWQEYDDGTCWEVNGGEYLAMYTNRNWYTVKRIWDPIGKTFRIIKTNELGLQIDIANPDELVAGDSFVVELFGTFDRTVYREGNTITIGIVQSDPRQLAGGVTGNDTHRWEVLDPNGAPLTPYDVINGGELPYTVNDLNLTIFRGPVNYAAGDEWSFVITAGQYEVSTDGGSVWTPPADIPTTPVTVLGSLQAEFLSGPGIDFEFGDEWRFLVNQPHTGNNAVSPNLEMWRPGVASADIEIPVSSQTVTLVAVLATVGVTVELKDGVGGSVLQTATFANPNEIGFAIFPATTTGAIEVRATTFDTDTGGVYYIWAGEPLRLTGEPDRLEVARETNMLRGSGINTGARIVARGYSAAIEYRTDNNSAVPLTNDDVDDLRSLSDALKFDGDLPLVFIPNVLREFAFMARWGDDDFRYRNTLDLNADIGQATYNSSQIELSPFYVPVIV